MQKAIVTNGVSYHDALARPGQPLADFDALDVHDLPRHELEAYDLLVVLRSVDGEALWARRHQLARFLDAGGVLVAFGEAWTNWFPGCRWEPECAEDLLPGVVAPHALFEGIRPDQIHWHGKGPRWCNHGHLLPPPGAEVLVANARGDAWLYADRQSTNGVILAATNLDLDTHAFHGGETARRLLQRVLAWAEGEASATADRRARQKPRIAGLFSGVNFQRGFFEDAEFGPSFAVLPAQELEGVDLARFRALWVPRESNQAMLARFSRKLEAYLRAGGTLVTFDEINQPWLAAVRWQQRAVDVASLRISDHAFVAGLALDDVRWHAHGSFDLPPGAIPLISDVSGAAVLYVDERSCAPGRLMAGTLDPDCHIGYGSDLPRPLLRAMLRWVQAEVSPPIPVAT
jgi:hypothetical protein